MRVLMLHNRYDTRGGEDESTDAEYRLLQAHGHDVDLLEANNSSIGRGISKRKAASSAIWSSSWHNTVAKELRSKQYDILHVQNFFPLISPSVYYAARAASVPVVQAVRNYRLICPSANLFRNSTVCTDCVGTVLKLPGVRHRCYRGSIFGSATVAAMSALHRIGGTWHSKVATYLAISEYVRDALVADGFDGNAIFVKPNFVEAEGVSAPFPHSKRKHILYVGRLTQEKGVQSLVTAYRASGLKVPLLLVGEGPVSGGEAAGVQALGRRPLQEVYRLMQEAYCVVMPGLWPEPFGRVAIESFANGTPVIATKLGGVAEIVEHNRNGFLTNPGDARGLMQFMRDLVENQGLSQMFALNALQKFQAKYSNNVNYEFLMRHYQAAIDQKKYN